MRLKRRVPVLSATVGLALVAGLGCSEEREAIMTRVGDYLLEFTIDASVAGGRPGGTSAVTDVTIGGIDTSHPDVFGRATSGARSYYQNVGAFQRGWIITPDRIQHAGNDPRLPALQATNVTVPRLIIGDPSSLEEEGWWNIWTATASGTSFAGMTGFKPNTTYTVAFMRLGLKVNGELDQLQMAQGLPVTEPDELVPVGGTPKGDPSVDLWYQNGPAIYAQRDANPYVIGHFVTTGDGLTAWDLYIWGSDPDDVPVLYADASGNPPDAAMDSSLVARNDLVATTLPRYNYLVIFEGAAATPEDVLSLPHAARIQLGTDFDAVTGEPIPNAYAPFPRALTKQEMLAGPGVAAKASALEVTFTNLAELAGATYQVWLINEETGAAISPPGNWTATAPNPDPEQSEPIVVGSAEGVRTFNSKANWTHTFRTSEEIVGQDIGGYTHVVLSIEASEASSPSNVQSLWARYTNMNGSPNDPFDWQIVNSAAMSFGTFNNGQNPQVFTATGTGRGWFWGTLPEEEMRVRFRDLNRPPVGYFYEGWVIPQAGRGEPYSIGELTTSSEEGFASLKDADIRTDLSTYVREDRILDALQRVKNQQLLNGNPWWLEGYELKVVPKARSGNELPPYTILGGGVPEGVVKRAP